LVDGRWEIVGPGLRGAIVAFATHDFGNGVELYATGFLHALGLTVGVVRLEGDHWVRVGDLVAGNLNAALATFDDGTGSALYAAGAFTLPGIANQPAVYELNDGDKWIPLPGNANDRIHAMAVFDDGRGSALYVGGQFTMIDGTIVNRIAKWNGESWTDVNGGIRGPVGTSITVHSMTVHDDGNGPALFVGGRFATAGQTTASNIAKWDGSEWSALSEGVDTNPPGFAGVFSLASWNEDSASALIVGGLFDRAGGNEISAITSWNGMHWSSLGNPLEFGGEPQVRSMSLLTETDGSTSLAIAGNFTIAGGIPSHNIAKWAPVTDAPFVTTQPFSQDADLGDDISIITQVWGGDLGYQWFKDGQPLIDDGHINGSTTDTLTITDVFSGDEAMYHLEAQSPCGSVMTQSALLHVVCQFDIAPAIGDGLVNVEDLLAVIQAWGSTGGNGWIPADVDDDGMVGTDDLLAVMGAWGPCP